jgi:hypothetical protein
MIQGDFSGFIISPLSVKFSITIIAQWQKNRDFDIFGILKSADLIQSVLFLFIPYYCPNSILK